MQFSVNLVLLNLIQSGVVLVPLKLQPAVFTGGKLVMDHIIVTGKWGRKVI